MRSIFSFFIFIAFSNCLAAESIVSCDTMFEQEVGGLPTITLTQFDRTPSKGWRTLSEVKCYSQAEDLLRLYMASHEPQSSLYLHIAQVQLSQEKRTAAATNFRKAQREGGIPEFKFNDFTLALAAYAEQDRIAFNKHTAIVAANIDNYGNRQNMNLLNTLANNFDKKYGDILTILEKESASK